MPHFSVYLAQDSDGTCRLKLAGEFDITGRAQADDALANINGGTRKIVLDLSDLEFIDSMGIHFVVTAHERVIAEGREFTIVRGKPEVDRVFNLVGLGDVLPFEDAA